MEKSQLIMLVDEKDSPIGEEEKYKVHAQGLLHRAFSVFVLNNKGELLLQRRAMHKYHSGGLWTNTCCSHGKLEEDFLVTVGKRMEEEFGFSCPVTKLFTFHYRAELDNDMVENEIDHVFLAEWNGVPTPNPEEICDWKWVELQSLKKDIEENPNNYTYWLKFVYERFLQNIRQ